MMNVAIDEKWVEVLNPVDDIQALVHKAMERYAIDSISTKISALAIKKRNYEARFGISFQAFHQMISTDIDFVNDMEQQFPNWESDLLEWEFCVKGIEDWRKKLEHILTI